MNQYILNHQRNTSIVCTICIRLFTKKIRIWSGRSEKSYVSARHVLCQSNVPAHFTWDVSRSGSNGDIFGVIDPVITMGVDLCYLNLCYLNLFYRSLVEKVQKPSSGTAYELYRNLTFIWHSNVQRYL